MTHSFPTRRSSDLARFLSADRTASAVLCVGRFALCRRRRAATEAGPEVELAEAGGRAGAFGQTGGAVVMDRRRGFGKDLQRQYRTEEGRGGKGWGSTGRMGWRACY